MFVCGRPRRRILKRVSKGSAVRGRAGGGRNGCVPCGGGERADGKRMKGRADVDKTTTSCAALKGGMGCIVGGFFDGVFGVYGGWRRASDNER